MNIIRLKKVNSTNTYLRERPELWSDEFTAVVAEEQTEGRGRHGRSWYSGHGKDLIFSIVFCPDIAGHWFPAVTIVAGIAVAEALRHKTGLSFNLKWPNDIYFKGKKIAGILCELAEDSKHKYVIIGIGVNVNSTVFPGDIPAADSLRNITGKEFNLEQLLFGVIDSLKEYLMKSSMPLPDDMIREYMSLCISINTEFIFEMNGMLKKGIFKSINTDGSVQLEENGSGKIINYFGEVFRDDE